MRRREFIIGITGAATAWPLAVLAQQPRMPVIGLLGAAIANDWTRYISAFRHGLHDAGYVEGDSVTIEPSWANNQYDQLPGMAAELVQRQVTVIAALSTPAAQAAKAATTTIPFHNEPRSSADWSRRQPKPPGWQYNRRDQLKA